MFSNRRYGIEIEAFGVSMNKVCAALNAAGILTKASGYTHDAAPHWKLVTDQSIRGEYPFELVSPILQGDAGLAQIDVVCGVLAACKARVNSSTGLHVHVDGADFTRSLTKVKNIARMWMKYETCFDQVVAPSRRDGNCMLRSNLELHGGSVAAAFAAISNAETLGEVMKATNEYASAIGRYRKFNLCSLLRHGTIEFRQHGGTIEAQKITAWVQAITDFADEAAGAVRISPRGAGDFSRLLGNVKNPKVRAYLSTRRQAFAAGAEATT
jgi:hypothetical protein